MKITNEFTVHTPIERAWALLTDLEGIAPCLPGAQLTGIDGDTYSGRVKVKVGPVVSDFAGTARFIAKDDEARRAVIDAKGRDSRSAGNAAAVVTAQLRADGDRTLVNVDTDLKISGKLAQFGSGMIKEVSGKLLGQFVTNLEAKLAAEPDAATAPSAAARIAAGSKPADQAPAADEAPAGRTTDAPLRAAAPDGKASGTPTPGSQDALETQSAPASQRAQVGPASQVGPAAQVGPATQDRSSGPAEKGAASAAATAGSAGADTAEGAANAGPTPAPDDSGSPAMGSAEGTESGEATESDAAVSPASLNGTTVRILPGQHAPLPAAAPLSSEPGGADVTPGGADVTPGSADVTAGGADVVPGGADLPGEAGTTARGDGVASGESVRVPDRFSVGDEPEALDLLALAGGSIYKRAIPLGIGAVVVAAVIVWFVARR